MPFRLGDPDATADTSNGSGAATMVDVATLAPQFPCPPATCGYDYVTLFEDATPTATTRLKKLVDGEWMNYANNSGLGIAGNYASAYVPEGWRMTVLRVATTGRHNYKDTGYVRVDVFDGPQPVVFDKSSRDLAGYVRLGVLEGTQVDWRNGRLLNLPAVHESLSDGAGNLAPSVPTLAHIVVFDLRSAELKARQRAQADRMVQVQSTKTEAELSTQEADYAEKLARATARAEEAFKLAQQSQSVREQIRAGYTETQTAAAADVVNQLVQATSASRIDAERQVQTAIEQNKLAIQQQFDQQYQAAKPFYQRTEVQLAAAFLVAMLIANRRR